MSLLTVIDSVPLYDTMREAKIWAKQYNLQGYHIHYFNGVKGYMGGSNHEEIMIALQNGIQTPLSATDQSIGTFAVTNQEINYYNSQTFTPQPQQPQPTPTSTPTPTPQPQTPSYTPPTTGGGSSGGGGGY
tara:strand:- start:579 stop:971 length:393 start_codon:yes stop_codon:yes gene_type:complete